ncbi:type VI secretion system lipoprotein TssJ [Pseudomonas huanghezhanensis]|uniref:type VI secretion system lipoprotein TssJ n=1 Tax=Pseudomonas huanghezhanensis TaxID=3002903 RepID=UPI0022859D8C|nr:type VI secretion system lipoprotein TssJ [Pseudomonas sp. BSw22131]
MFRRFLLMAVAVLLMTSCASDSEPEGPQPLSIALHFVAQAGVNPGSTGEPAPVRVRIYELKNDASFLRVDYFSLVERSQAVLDADLVDQGEALIHPGEQKIIGRTLHPDTVYVGLAVAYRDIDNAQWRTVLTVLPQQANAFLINLDALGVRSDAALNLDQ